MPSHGGGHGGHGGYGFWRDQNWQISIVVVVVVVVVGAGSSDDVDDKMVKLRSYYLSIYVCPLVWIYQHIRCRPHNDHHMNTPKLKHLQGQPKLSYPLPRVTLSRALINYMTKTSRLSRIHVTISYQNYESLSLNYNCTWVYYIIPVKSHNWSIVIIKQHQYCARFS